MQLFHPLLASFIKERTSYDGGGVVGDNGAGDDGSGDDGDDGSGHGGGDGDVVDGGDGFSNDGGGGRTTLDPSQSGDDVDDSGVDDRR